MSIAFVIAAYGILLGLVAPLALADAPWTERAPRLAIAVWQAVTLGVVGALLLALIVWVGPGLGLAHAIGAALRLCSHTMHQLEAAPGGVPTTVVGVATFAAGVGRIGWAAARTGLLSRRTRRRHRALLDVVASPEPALGGAVVIEHDTPLAYCVPGGGGSIVLTSGALGSLDDDGVAGVLAHERAHLRGRHHWVLGWHNALAVALPFVPGLCVARREVAKLVEMAADDAATRRTSRLALARALVTLGSHPAPAGALGVSGSTAVRRVRRLLRPEPPLGRVTRGAALAGGSLLATAPVVVALVPMLNPAAHGFCPF